MNALLMQAVYCRLYFGYNKDTKSTKVKKSGEKVKELNNKNNGGN